MTQKFDVWFICDLKEVQFIYLYFKMKAQQKERQPEQSSYEFFMKPNQPDSLVMLKTINQIIPLLVNLPVYILIDPPTRLQHLFKQKTGIKFILFPQLSLTKDYIKKQLKNKKIVIVASLDMARDVNELCEFKEVKLIYYHNIGSNLSSDDYFQILMEGRFAAQCFDTIMRKIRYIGKDIQDLVDTEDDDTQKFKNYYNLKTQSNMISLSDNGWECSILLRTIIAMVKQENTCRKELNQKLLSLYYNAYQGFLNPYGWKQQLDNQVNSEQPYKAIKLYTLENSPFNFITNNLLRSAKNPSEIYYCQPFFRDLFMTIRNLYENQELAKPNQELVCYRGAAASEEEIEFYRNNVGKIILNLGFLSTSRNSETAAKFADNLFFVIKVKKEKRDKVIDYGCADISQHSRFIHEEEVLFNPLNSFTIEKCGHHLINDKKQGRVKKRVVKTIYLKYGSLAQIKRKKEDHKKVTEKQQCYANQINYFIEITKNIENQGDVFVSSNDYLEGGAQYWEEMLKHETDQLKRSKILNIIGVSNMYRGKYEEALNYLLECLTLSEKIFGKAHPSCANTLKNIGNIFDMMGKYEEALNYHQECLTIQQKVLGKAHPHYANSLNNIGNILVNLEKHREALKSYQECLTIQQKLSGKTHPHYANSLNNIGSVFVKMGKYGQALKYYQECLTIQQKVLGKAHPHYAIFLNNIADVLVKMGKYEQALKYFQECLMIQQKILGKSHPDFASSLNNIANVFDQVGKYKEALKSYQECLIIQQKVLGRNHPDFANSLNGIGSVCAQIGKYEEALKYYKESLSIKQKLLGESHSDYTVSLNNIGNILVKMGKYEQALKYYKECISIQQKLLGSSHPDYARSLNNIGSVFEKMGKYEKALKYYEKSLAIKQRVLGKSHPDFVISLNNIGSVFEMMGKLEESIKCHQESLVIRQKILGKLHPDYVNSLNNIGFISYKMGAYDKALKYHQECLTIRQKILGKTHPDYANSLSNIGSVFQKIEKYQQALEYHQTSLAIRQSVLGKFHPDYANSLNNIGILLNRIGQYQKALSYHEKCLQVRQKTLGTTHPDYARGLKNIGSVYETMGQYQQALEYHQKSLAIQQSVLSKSHPDYAGSLNNIGMVLKHMGKYQRAFLYFQLCMSIIQITLNSNHPLFVACQQNLQAIKIQIRVRKSDRQATKENTECK